MWQLKTVVFLHLCLIWAVPFNFIFVFQLNFLVSGFAASYLTATIDVFNFNDPLSCFGFCTFHDEMIVGLLHSHHNEQVQ